MYIRRRF